MNDSDGKIYGLGLPLVALGTVLVSAAVLVYVGILLYFKTEYVFVGNDTALSLIFFAAISFFSGMLFWERATTRICKVEASAAGVLVEVIICPSFYSRTRLFTKLFKWDEEIQIEAIDVDMGEYNSAHIVLTFKCLMPGGIKSINVYECISMNDALVQAKKWNECKECGAYFYKPGFPAYAL